MPEHVMTELRLLVIDDDPKITALVAQVAEEMNFIVRAVCDNEAVFAYHDFKPDVIVLDIVMPQMDGFEILQFLKEQKSTATVVILSGSYDFYLRMADHLASALRVPIHTHLHKPFRIHELRRILRDIQLLHATPVKRTRKAPAN